MEAIRAGIANADNEAVYRAAHTLKGTVGNFDAYAAMAITQRLEALARGGDLAACAPIFSALNGEIDALLTSLAATSEALQCAS
jgi:two-component system sensor histidine kinase/response regulator